MCIRDRTPTANDWPPGYQLTMTLPLTGGRSSKRPYVAVWVEDATGKLIRILAFWTGKSKYSATLSTMWERLHGNMNRMKAVTRATRSPGKYDLTWDGLDEEHKPT